jgi:hypothetical protein
MKIRTQIFHLSQWGEGEGDWIVQNFLNPIPLTRLAPLALGSLSPMGRVKFGTASDL